MQKFTNWNGISYEVDGKKWGEALNPSVPNKIHNAILADIDAGYEFGRAYDEEDNRFFSWNAA